MWVNSDVVDLGFVNAWGRVVSDIVNYMVSDSGVVKGGFDFESSYSTVYEASQLFTLKVLTDHSN